MKKMLLATAWPYLLQDAQQTFTVQNKPAALIAPKGNHHPSFLRFWNWARRKLSMQPNLWRRRKYYSNEASKHS